MLAIRGALRGADSYRTLIAAEFERRRQRNKSYSLRAFARDAKVSPSYLSEVLTGKYDLSRQQGENIAATMGYNKVEVEFFCDLVDSCETRSDSVRELARLRLRRYIADSEAERLELDVFKLIADWYHFAIIEALKLQDAKADPAWLAAALRIDVEQTEDALERLLRLGFLQRAADGGFSIAKGHTYTGNTPSDSIKHFHASMLEKAKDALFSQPFQDRVVSTTTLAIDASKLPEYRTAMENFRRQVIDLAKASDVCSHVYALSVQFFRLSHEEA